MQSNVLHFKKLLLILLTFNVDKFLHELFIDDKFTQDTLDTFNWDILDVILYNVPVDVISVQFIPTDVVLLLFTLFLTYPSEGTNVS